jgi:adenosylhomocysteinase
VSFSVQALALAWLASGEACPAPGVHEVPAAIDAQVAGLTLAALGTEVDTLSAAQQQYLDSWRQGS